MDAILCEDHFVAELFSKHWKVMFKIAAKNETEIMAHAYVGQP
jgi:hypothetical protein